MCCTWLAGNTGSKNRNFGTITPICRAMSSRLRHVSTIRKKLVKQQSSICPHNMVNFGPLTAEIGLGVWGTPANFNVTARHSSSERQPKCGIEQRAPPIFGRAAITLGIRPHSSFFITSYFLEIKNPGTCWMTIVLWLVTTESRAGHVERLSSEEDRKQLGEVRGSSCHCQRRTSTCCWLRRIVESYMYVCVYCSQDSYNWFLQCAAMQCSHCKHCTSYSNSVCLSVCHTPVLCQNNCSLHCQIAKCV